MAQKRTFEGKVYSFPDKATEEQITAHFRKIKAISEGENTDKPSDEAPKGKPEEKSYVGGLARAGAQGLTMGFGDEIEAGVRSVFSDKDYASELKGVRSDIEQFSKNNPKAALAAELAGGAASFLVPGAIAAKGAAKVAQATQAAKTGKAAQVAGKALSSAGAAFPKTAGLARESGKVLSPVAKGILGGGVQGAIYGAGASTEGERLAGAQTGGLLGAAGGGIVGAAFPAIGGVAKKLIKEGVQLTPGQAMGGLPRMAENLLSVTPFIGESIKKARGQAIAGFTRATMNRALAPIGKKVSKDKSGIEAFDEAMDQVSEAYQDVLPKLNIEDAESLSRNMRAAQEKIKPEVRLYQKDEKDKFTQTIDGILEGLPTAGKIPGKVVKEIDSKIGAEMRIEQFKNPKLSYALSEFQKSFRDEIKRQDPKNAGKLRDADSTYSRLLPIERSINKAITQGGKFTPEQFLTSLKTGQQRKVARGLATDQQFGSDAANIMRESTGGAFVTPLLGLGIAREAVGGRLRPLMTSMAGGAAAAGLYGPGLGLTRGLLGGVGSTTRPFIGTTAGMLGAQKEPLE
tara:strand:+ start:555 stop:2270 length:1716 start_codon:yes stop_codon:yes gene_type:complete